MKYCERCGQARAFMANNGLCDECNRAVKIINSKGESDGTARNLSIPIDLMPHKTFHKKSTVKLFIKSTGKLWNAK